MRWLPARRLVAGILVAAGPHVAHGALLQDIERDDASAVRRALDAGEITVNAPVGEPPVPIIAAAARAGSIRVVHLLVERKADLDAKTQVGETAVMLASFVPDASGESGAPAQPVQAEIVRVLVEAGASLENPGNLTAVSYAAYAGHLEILRYLLDRNASPDGGATGGEYRYPTPLAMAVMKVMPTRCGSCSNAARTRASRVPPATMSSAWRASSTAPSWCRRSNAPWLCHPASASPSAAPGASGRLQG
jgi:ankyrin repeat protein